MNMFACVISRVSRCVSAFLRALVVARLDERLVGLARTGLRGDVGAQVADHVAAFVDVGGRPAAALAVEKVRTAAFEPEQRRIIDRRLIDLAGVLRDKLSDHLEMAELLHRDVLQHVADAGILDVERLDPILQRRRQLAGCAAELLQQKCAEACVRLADLDRLDQFLAV